MSDQNSLTDSLTDTVNKNAVLVAVSIHRPGITKKVKSGRIQVRDQADGVESETDPSLLTLSKKLLDSAEFDAIRTADGEFYRAIGARVIPSRYRRGVYLLPLKLLPWFEEQFERYTIRRQKLVDSFMAVYGERIEEAKRQLSTLFNGEDYPSPEQVRDAFFLERGYESAGIPAQLQEANPALFEREQQRLRGAMDQAAEEVRGAMRQGLLQLVRHLQSRLALEADGSKKKLHETAVTKLQEWLELFSDRNVTNDGELAVLVAKARRVMDSADRERLKKDDSVRAETLNTLTEVGAELDRLVVTVPKRKITFDE